MQDAVAALRAAFDTVAACDLELLTRDELLETMDELESLGCRLPGLGHRLLARLQTETTAREMGAPNPGKTCCGSGGASRSPKRIGA
ncbi:hypothetical protein MPRF_33850 [Mycolicibacterium parafortuitum]|uniref:Uncharacterized protein n=1 Tax=Mycolicibacterium parafortuitum TaxID=39692 RepID=A0A7I7U7Z4_MYCPF|nr:hypothetical protein MPRF_33850 [Mycolicibacterium parafortuitum]